MDLFSQRGPTFIEPPTFIEVYGVPGSGGGQPIDPHVKCSRIFMKRIEIMNRYYFIQNYIEGKSNNTKELILVNITNNI